MQTSTIRISPGSISARQYAGRDSAVVHGIPIGDPGIVEDIAATYDARLFEPVKVRDLGGGRYELVDGHHRLAAALTLGLDEIPALVVEFTSDVDRLALQVAANNARAQDTPETKGALFAQLVAGGMPEDTAAAKIGVKLGTARKYAALAQAPDTLREWYRDGRIPLEVVAMIADKPIRPGTMRKLAESYIREKAAHPKTRPEDFRLYLDEFTRQVLAGPARAVQTLLCNDEESPEELAAVDRAEKAVARRRIVDFEKTVKGILAQLEDPAIAAAVCARAGFIPAQAAQALALQAARA